MEFELNPKSVSFKDMNPLQLKAIFDFIDVSVECAIEEFDPVRLKKLEDHGTDLIEIFGGIGMKIEVNERR